MVLPAIAGAVGIGSSLVGSLMKQKRLREAQNRIQNAPLQSEAALRSSAARQFGIAGSQPGVNPLQAYQQAAATNRADRVQAAGIGAAERTARLGQMASLDQQIGSAQQQMGAAVGAGLGTLGAGLVAAQPPQPQAKVPVPGRQQQQTQYQSDMDYYNQLQQRPFQFSPFSQNFRSDERIKSQIRDAGYEVDEFLDALQDRRFTITVPDGTQNLGTREAIEVDMPTTGVVAQDLQESQVGREMTRPGPGGVLEVDSNRALQGTMAGLGRVNERLRSLEALMPVPTALRRLGASDSNTPQPSLMDRLRRHAQTNPPTPGSAPQQYSLTQQDRAEMQREDTQHQTVVDNLVNANELPSGTVAADLQPRIINGLARIEHRWQGGERSDALRAARNKFLLEARRRLAQQNR